MCSDKVLYIVNYRDGLGSEDRTKIVYSRSQAWFGPTASNIELTTFNLKKYMIFRGAINELFHLVCSCNYCLFENFLVFLYSSNYEKMWSFIISLVSIFLYQLFFQTFIVIIVTRALSEITDKCPLLSNQWSFFNSVNDMIFLISLRIFPEIMKCIILHNECLDDFKDGGPP